MHHRHRSESEHDGANSHGLNWYGAANMFLAGTLDAAPAKLRVALHISKADDGNLKATLSHQRRNRRLHLAISVLR